MAFCLHRPYDCKDVKVLLRTTFEFSGVRVPLFPPILAIRRAIPQGYGLEASIYDIHDPPPDGFASSEVTLNQSEYRHVTYRRLLFHAGLAILGVTGFLPSFKVSRGMGWCPFCRDATVLPYPTGLYMSPNLFRKKEKLQVEGSEIPTQNWNAESREAEMSSISHQRFCNPIMNILSEHDESFGDEQQGDSEIRMENHLSMD
ncbi:hypothetical protein Tco_1335671 [Tanacetum coccineum]